MKTLLALSAALLLAAPALAEDGPAALPIGTKAPMTDVKMQATTGKSLSIAEAAGKKGTLVVFTCNHCPFAKAWEERIARLGNDALKAGVGVIAINANDPSAYPEDDFAGMQARAKKLGLKFPYVVDATSDLARAYGATRTPEVFLFDANGQLVYHGAVDDNAREPGAVKQRWLQDAVTAVAAGKAVPTAETKALGCTIKYREKKSS